jgi:hypothetical protein
MLDDLRSTWGDIAHYWDDWGPPLRPCPEDLAITRQAVVQWHAQHPAERAHVFLCGVTPEIATMSWPCPIDLIAMDQAESMVRLVWPGDVPGVRRAMVGNWMESGQPPRSRDLVIGDGGFGFFDYPIRQRALALALHTLLKPDGLLIYRHYAQAEQPETLGDVLAAMRDGTISTFHVFKWRLAMALQADSASGVRLHDVWQACTDARIERNRLPQPGWSQRAVETIRFYRDKEARLFFPTLREFGDLLAELFDPIHVQFPTYELGQRCPILTARPRIR